MASVVLGVVCVAASLQSTLSAELSATSFMSGGLWRRLVDGLGGEIIVTPRGTLTGEIGYAGPFVLTAAFALASWFGGAVYHSVRSRRPFATMLAEWGLAGWRWWWLAGAWELLQLLASQWNLKGISAFLVASPQFLYAFLLAGWATTFLTLANRPADSGIVPPSPVGCQKLPISVWLAAGIYLAVLGTMNWQLYRGLLIPHGDSAMYEEHLWNVLHGKGFRSYLDQGLFLGEHVQVIHLLLIPIYWFFPTHMLLEFCESLALACGAFPVYWMACRHTGSKRAAMLLAAAYLLYFPLHFLDIAIDLKTFRPISFGVPLLLLALDQLERGRYKTCVALLALTLSAKEDYAIVLAPLGLWIAVRQPAVSRATTAGPVHNRAVRLFGLGLAAFAAVYLVLVTQVVIPYFRGGAEVHYARYFEAFGKSLDEIAVRMVTHPGLLLGKLATVKTAQYFLAMVLSLGFVPLRSPGRLAVGLPIFVLLCLNELSQAPWHHFHAPLVPIVFWAAAAGLAPLHWGFRTAKEPDGGEGEPASGLRMGGASMFAAHLTWTSALATSLFVSLTPVGLAFWDQDSSWYWRKLYIPGERAVQFAKVFPLIPQNSRVASTDFVHTRFTHHERSYDYSDYPRKVSGYELRVPDDTDYIVIDTQHPYSKIKVPEQIREYREHPERWELLPDETNGYFIVLKRIR